MSKQSSSTANARPNPASEDETVTPVSNSIGLTELAASLEALNLEADQNTAIVHCTQTSSPVKVREVSRSPDKKDQKKASPVQGHKPWRYALQMWLQVEVGPGLFVPPEDDSFSVHYAMEAINQAYPGCTGTTWIGMATCWPFMAERAAQGLASCRTLWLRSAGL